MARTMVEDAHRVKPLPSPPRREAAKMRAPPTAYSRTALRRLTGAANRMRRDSEIPIRLWELTQP